MDKKPNAQPSVCNFERKTNWSQRQWEESKHVNYILSEQIEHPFGIANISTGRERPSI